LWLRLERVGTAVTASYAADAGGAPGTWTSLGSAATITMGSGVGGGMGVSAGGGTTGTATPIFQHGSVTPAFSGPAVHAEDLGNYPGTHGSSSVAGGVTTINAVGAQDASGGHFRYQQIWGDCMVTARLTSHSGINRGAQFGVSIRDT